MPPHVLAIARREVQGMEERQNSLTGSLLCIQAEMMVNFFGLGVSQSRSIKLRALIQMNGRSDLPTEADRSSTVRRQFMTEFARLFGL